MQLFPNRNLKSTYYPFINIVRAIAMLLVIVGHASKDPIVLKTIYSFHMPLFFILSGILFRPYEDQKAYFLKRFKSLIIPYFAFYLLTLVYYWFIEVKFRPSEISNEWLRLIPLVYGADLNGYMSHNVVLWFLPALFSLEVIFNWLVRIKNQWLLFSIVAVISISGFILAQYSIWYLPWGVSQAMAMLIFYYLGFKLNSFFKNMGSLSKTNLFMVILSTLVLILISPYIDRNDVASGVFPNVLLFILSACAGTILVISIAKFVKSSKVLEILGHGDVTITVLAFQGVIYRPMIFFADKLLPEGGGQK